MNGGEQMGMLREHRYGVAVTIVILLLGSSYYLLIGPASSRSALEPRLIDGLELKAAALDGSLKLFALAPNNPLARMRAQGDSVPEQESIIIGSSEAAMMREEGLFKEPGDRLTGFFGIDTRVGGVLKPTGTLVDMLHFLSPEQYGRLSAEQGNVFVKRSPEGLAKLFYTLEPEEESIVLLRFQEGAASGYAPVVSGNTTFMPVILGSSEAAMMRKERLFAKVGDRLSGFFGQDVFIAGVLEPSGTPLDMIHITPLREEELQGAEPSDL